MKHIVVLTYWSQTLQKTLKDSYNYTDIQHMKRRGIQNYNDKI